MLPEVDRVEFCRRLRRRPDTEPYTYRILLTAKGQKQRMLEARGAGAEAFRANPSELKTRFLVGERIVELQQKLISANGALYHAASHDYLTKLWNRAAIIACLQREVARSLRERAALGVILVDVDHFKKVNDELGHDFAHPYPDSSPEKDGHRQHQSCFDTARCQFGISVTSRRPGTVSSQAQRNRVVAMTVALPAGRL